VSPRLKIKRSNTLKFLVAFAAIAGIATAYIGTFRASVDAASGGVAFEHFATHPYASKTGYDKTSKNYYTGQLLCPTNRDFCPDGQTINDMGITANGELVAGYGEWNSNVDSFGVAEGGVYVVPLKLSDGTWGNNPIRAGSEALDVIREIDGDIYAPTTDPSDKIATGQTTNNQAGYITSQGGNWRFVRVSNRMLHTFDVAKLAGKGIWVVGSDNWNGSDPAVAVAYHSADDGATWQLSTNDDSTPPGAAEWERYYWLARLNDKLYLHAAHVQPESPTYKMYNGSQWVSASSADKMVCDQATYPKLVESFDGHVVCGKFEGIDLFDGENTVSKNLPHNEGVHDFYVHQNKLYILSRYGNIYVMSSANSRPEYIGKAGEEAESARSIAVHNDYVYLGGDGGKIWRSTTTLSNAPPAIPTPEITSVSPSAIVLDGSTKSITISGTGFGTNPTVKIAGKQVTVSSSSDTSVVVSIDTIDFRPGKVNVEFSNGHESASQSDAIEFTPDNTRISTVHTGEKSGSSRIIKITGSGLLSGENGRYWAVGLRHRLVELNGRAIPACASKSAYSVLQNYYDKNTLTTSGACYQLIDYDVAANKIKPLMSDSSITILVPEKDFQPQGTVRILGGIHGDIKITESDVRAY
jgi:hypothetical protein